MYRASAIQGRMRTEQSTGIIYGTYNISFVVYFVSLKLLQINM